MIPKFSTSASRWMLVPFTDMRGRTFFFSGEIMSSVLVRMLMGLSDGNPLNV